MLVNFNPEKLGLCTFQKWRDLHANSWSVPYFFHIKLQTQ